MFAGALAEIKHDSSRVLPAVLESLAIAIGAGRDLYFTLLKTIISGQSSNAIHLRKAGETKLVCELFLGLSTQALQSALDSCAQRINREIRESSFFFSYGLTERDTSKRFLLVYLSIEHWLGEIFGDLSKADAGVAVANIFNESLGKVESRVL